MEIVMTQQRKTSWKISRMIDDKRKHSRQYYTIHGGRFGHILGGVLRHASLKIPLSLFRGITDENG